MSSQERRLIDRALMLGASIQMLNSYFGLTTSKVSARRSLLGKQEPMGRKPAATEEEEKLFGTYGKSIKVMFKQLNQQKD